MLGPDELAAVQRVMGRATPADKSRLVSLELADEVPARRGRLGILRGEPLQLQLLCRQLLRAVLADLREADRLLSLARSG